MKESFNPNDDEHTQPLEAWERPLYPSRQELDEMSEEEHQEHYEYWHLDNPQGDPAVDGDHDMFGNPRWQ